MKTKISLIVALLLSAISIAQTTFTIDGLNYRVTSTNPDEVAITGGTDVPQNLIIPATVIDNDVTYSVTSISNSAFEFEDDQGVARSSKLARNQLLAITSVSIPNTIREIGFNAFSGNQITSLTLPSALVTINNGAFFENPITKVTALSTVPPEIDNDAFGNVDTTSATLTIPAGTLEAYIDNGWGIFGTIIAGDTTFEGTFTVAGINYLVTSINPDIVSVIGQEGTLNAITIPNTVSNAEITYLVNKIGNGAFKGNNLTSVTLPDTITEIEDEAFTDNRLTSIVIPNTVTTIGFLAFEDNIISQLTLSSNLSELGFGAFKNNRLTSVVIPNSLIRINNNTFENNRLTNVVIPDSITRIGIFAFAGNLLTNVDIPNSVTTIDNVAFKDNRLTNIVIPNRITSINFGAFENNRLTSVTIPDNIRNIRGPVFRGNPLTEVISLATIPPTITAGISDSFGNNRDNIDVTVPAGTKQAYEDTGWTGFKSITEVDPINLKVFLQGATLNTIAGEGDLMRDDLRTSGVLQDFINDELGDPIDPAFAIEGPKAVVDFITVELRQTNNFILGRLPSLLHRDGTVTIENLEFFLDEVGTLPETILIAIYHRNHIPIITANPISTEGNSITVDFTDPNQVQGGTVALQQVGDRFTMISGDPNGDGQVLSTDLIQVVAEIGTSGYSNSDLDMNGQILSTDILIGNQNIGRGQQF